ncbi:MAG: XdhC family protein [Acidobacteria bacterium]|nr:XdhC family protein [Acidobacteriota bacterium]MCI0663008.1 XdhC family protein [Acidobacteriota bacterium]
MLTAAEISSSLKRSLEEGRSLAIVSLLERDGKPGLPTARLLVEEGGRMIGGTLGDRALDEIAVRHAIGLFADEKEEISVAKCKELLARFVNDGEDAFDGDEISAYSDARLLFEVSRPPLELIVCGGGHVGQAVARAARFLGFNVTVIDDRADFASREKFPDHAIRLIADDFIEGLRSLKITPACHLVIVTRGHRHDEICLREVIDKPARYIGMIGSRRRATTIREHLRREGIGADLLRRVHAPIGLDIGAQTPEEIGLAILAEIVLSRRGGTGRPKSDEGPMARAR